MQRGALHVADMSWQTCAMPLHTAQTCPLACPDHPISEVQLICAALHLQHMPHEQQKICSSTGPSSWAETVCQDSTSYLFLFLLSQDICLLAPAHLLHLC